MRIKCRGYGTALVAVLLLAACGLSPAEQRAADQQSCAGYGFAAGSEAFANCMMSTQHRRDDQAAADRRAQEAQAAADARQRALQDSLAEQQRQKAVAIGTSDPSSIDTSIPKITTLPEIVPAPDNMVCTSSQVSNAGSVNCHSP